MDFLFMQLREAADTLTELARDEGMDIAAHKEFSEPYLPDPKDRPHLSLRSAPHLDVPIGSGASAEMQNIVKETYTLTRGT